MKQTAVEWLLFEMSKNGLLPNGVPKEIHNKAKEMKEQQISEAWDSAYGGDSNHDGEQYYNETFKKK